MHGPPQDSTVLALPGNNDICQGPSTPHGRPNQAISAHHTDCPHPEQSEEFHLRQDSESTSAFPLRVGVNIFLRMREHGCPATTPVSNYPTAQGLRSGAPLSQRLKHHIRH